MPKKYYTANDSTFVDGINKIIHLKDRETEFCIKRPTIQASVVFSSYVDLLKYHLGTDLILCPHCFQGLAFENFKKVPGLDFDKCKAQSSKNEENRLKFLNK